MKLLALGIAFAFLPACVVGNPVAEEQKSDEQRLREDIGPMCEAACRKGAECELETGPDCPQQCRDYMAAFVDHGGACVEVGKSILDCTAKLATCEELASDGRCNVTQEERDQCASTGSGDLPHVVYCDGGSGTSAGLAPNADGEGAKTTSCDLYEAGCSDGSDYRVSCHAAEDTIVCNCFKDGVVNGIAFTPLEGGCPAEAEINAPCGWNLAH